MLHAETKEVIDGCVRSSEASESHRKRQVNCGKATKVLGPRRPTAPISGLSSNLQACSIAALVHAKTVEGYSPNRTRYSAAASRTR
jgi:hypothetical protein